MKTGGGWLGKGVVLSRDSTQQGAGRNRPRPESARVCAASALSDRRLGIGGAGYVPSPIGLFYLT